MTNKVSGRRQRGCTLRVTLELGLPEIIMIIEGLDREIQAKRAYGCHDDLIRSFKDRQSELRAIHREAADRFFKAAGGDQ